MKKYFKAIWNWVTAILVNERLIAAQRKTTKQEGRTFCKNWRLIDRDMSINYRNISAISIVLNDPVARQEVQTAKFAFLIALFTSFIRSSIGILWLMIIPGMIISILTHYDIIKTIPFMTIVWTVLMISVYVETQFYTEYIKCAGREIAHILDEQEG